MTDRILPSLTELTLGDLSSLLVRTGGMALPQGPEEEAKYINYIKVFFKKKCAIFSSSNEKTLFQFLSRTLILFEKHRQAKKEAK